MMFASQLVGTPGHYLAGNQGGGPPPAAVLLVFLAKRGSIVHELSHFNISYFYYRPLATGENTLIFATSVSGHCYCYC